MPTLAGFPLTTISQNCLRFAFTPRIEVTKVPPTLAEYLPFHLPCVAASRAPAALLPGHLPRGVRPLVMEPFSPCTAVGPSRVLVRPLTRTVTVGPEPAASAALLAGRARTIAPTRAIRVLRFMR